MNSEVEQVLEHADCVVGAALDLGVGPFLTPLYYCIYRPDKGIVEVTIYFKYEDKNHRMDIDIDPVTVKIPHLRQTIAAGMQEAVEWEAELWTT